MPGKTERKDTHGVRTGGGGGGASTLWLKEEDGQDYAIARKMTGQSFVLVYCVGDGKLRNAKIRGALKKKPGKRIVVGDWVLVGLRGGCGDKKCDILDKYSMDQVRQLRKLSELPEKDPEDENAKTSSKSSSSSSSEDGKREDECVFDFEDI